MKWKEHEWQPGEAARIRGANQYSSETVKRSLDEIRADILESFAAKSEQSLTLAELEEALGEEVFEDLDFLVDCVRKYFSRYGIDVKFGPLFVAPTESGLRHAEGGLTGGVSAIEPRIVGDIELKRLAFLKIVAHELYHSTAVTTFTRQEEGLTQDNIGASYILDPTSPHARLLEEGLACAFEGEVFGRISAERFSEEVVGRYYGILAQVCENRPELIDKIHGDLNRLTISSLDLRSGRLQWQYDSYGAAAEVVYLLDDVIPNFRELVERARVERSTLPLARAIETHCGKGMYRTLTASGVHEAEEVLQELKIRFQE